MAGVLPHLQRLDERGHWGIKLGLENPRRLLAALGHPEQRFPAVLIAGTNGKGSTGAFLAHALKACGHRIGWTTSPHLVSPTERIWIDGAPLSAEALDGFLAQAFLAEERLGIKATYFELMIASALLAFREAGVELALAEVGMGGRWDATNVLDPIVTVLTHVGLDHMAFLGETKEVIAREKLATARAGRPLVLGPSLEVDWVRPLLEVEPVLCPAPPVVAESVQWDHSVVQGHRVGLAGLHQLENLATALETLRQLQHLGWHLPDDALWRGIAQTQWPGRLWVVPGLENVWMDGAHNPDGAAVVARHAKACGVRPHLLFGAMGDKDLPAMARILKTLEPLSITLIRGDNPRYAAEDALRAAWGDVPVRTIAHAVADLRKPSSETRLVTGSLFLLGDLLRELKL